MLSFDKSMLVKENDFIEVGANLGLELSCAEGLFGALLDRELFTTLHCQDRTTVSRPHTFSVRNCTWIDTGQGINRKGFTRKHGISNHSTEECENVAQKAAKVFYRGKAPDIPAIPPHFILHVNPELVCLESVITGALELFQMILVNESCTFNATQGVVTLQYTTKLKDGILFEDINIDENDLLNANWVFSSVPHAEHTVATFIKLLHHVEYGITKEVAYDVLGLGEAVQPFHSKLFLTILFLLTVIFRDKKCNEVAYDLSYTTMVIWDFKNKDTIGVNGSNPQLAIIFCFIHFTAQFDTSHVHFAGQEFVMLSTLVRPLDITNVIDPGQLNMTPNPFGILDLIKSSVKKGEHQFLLSRYITTMSTTMMIKLDPECGPKELIEIMISLVGVVGGGSIIILLGTYQIAYVGWNKNQLDYKLIDLYKLTLNEMESSSHEFRGPTNFCVLTRHHNKCISGDKKFGGVYVLNISSIATAGEEHATITVLNPNLEDKVLIENGSIVMNQSNIDIGLRRSNTVKRPSRRLIWDPGPIRNWLKGTKG